jgi:hypothetical protein
MTTSPSATAFTHSFPTPPLGTLSPPYAVYDVLHSESNGSGSDHEDDYTSHLNQHLPDGSLEAHESIGLASSHRLCPFAALDFLAGCPPLPLLPGYPSMTALDRGYHSSC